MKKIISLVVATTLLFSLNVSTIFADQVIVNGDNTTVIYDEPIEVPTNIKQTRNPGLNYITKSSTLVDTSGSRASVLVAGQNPGGVSMPNGGAVWVNEKGGSSTTVSLGVAWGVCSIAITPGSINRSAIGYCVNISASRYYYKVYADKEFTVRKYRDVVYEASNPSREFVYHRTTASLIRTTYRVVRQ